jgi:peptidoglycan/LPS O-acetylase OafA/YrhL
MSPSLSEPVGHTPNLARGLVLEAKAWVGSKLDRRDSRDELAQYTHFYNNQMPHQVLHDSIANLPTWLRHQIAALKSPTWLLPSFVQERLYPKPKTKSGSAKISTLDGLRGLACLAVLHMHWTFAVTDSNDGGDASINTKYLFHRPFFYLFWAGSSHVNIFFVMSGYVLSIKCLKMIHAGQPVQNIITSAVFRRAIRIFLPPLILLFIYLISIRIGIFDKSNAVFEENRYWHRYQVRMFETPPPVLATFWEQLWDVLGAAERLMDPSTQFQLPEYGKYDTHLWTMPTEFYCSMALYVVLLATCRLYIRYRLTLHTLLVIWCWSTSHQTHALFFSGMTIAEFDVLFKRYIDSRSKISTPPTPVRMNQPPTHQRFPSSSTNTLSRLPLRSYITPSNLLCTTSTLIGLYLLSMPLLWAEATPPYDTILTYMPSYMSIGQQGEALRALGALLTVWPITFLSATSPSNPITTFLLANPISAYLGNISFAMYLCHGFIIRSLGYVILPSIYLLVISDPKRREELQPQALGDITGDGIDDFADSYYRLTMWEIGWIWMLGYAIVLPVCIWMADLFWRGVDVRCVTLGRWVEEQMVMKDSEIAAGRGVKGRGEPGEKSLD